MLIGNHNLYVLSPNFRPVGGIAKLLDYAVHADHEKYDVHFVTITDNHIGSGVLDKPYYRRSRHVVKLSKLDEVTFCDGDIVLFSLPQDFNRLLKRLHICGYPDVTIVHLVQNVRHENVFFENGIARQLLFKGLFRICITQQVYAVVSKYNISSEMTTVIPHCFDFIFFKNETLSHVPTLRIGYNTFKSKFGELVQSECLKRNLPVTFLTANSGISWDNLRDFYFSCDVFLGTPLREEGYYLPGMEALAAGNILICPDAVGNKSYLSNEFVKIPRFENVDDYVFEIELLLKTDCDARAELRKSAVEFASQYRLEAEAELFNDFLNLLPNAGFFSRTR